MSPNGLRQFLEKEQSLKEVNAEFAVGLIRRFDPSPSKEMGRMTLAGIIEFPPRMGNDARFLFNLCAQIFTVSTPFISFSYSHVQVLRR